MKNLISIIIVLSLSILGCTENGDLVSPNSSQNGTTQIAPNWLKFPAADQSRLNKITTVSQSIDGSIGGSITLFDEYSGGPFQFVYVEAEIQFNPGAYYGTKNITLSVDDNDCIVEFGPSSVFEIPANYTMTITGLDLSNVNVSQIDFVYLRVDGTTEAVAYDKIDVDVAKGKIKVLNAKLDHFSRYGWVN